MAQQHDQFPEPDFAANEASAPAPRRARWLLALGALLLLALGLAWTMRKDIADNVIAAQLESLGLPARYKVVSIGPSEQVIRDLVIGDPRRPDLAIAELRVATRLYLGLPGIGRITIVRPRLYGTFRDGRVSFGSLDKALFTGAGAPFEMPDLDVALVDGRALIESDVGRIGVKLEGKGPLRGGFAGTLAAITPELALDGCKAGRTSLYGKLTTTAQRPRFEGPVRMQVLSCPDRALTLARAGLLLDLRLDEALDGGEGKLGFDAGPGGYAEARLGRGSGTARFTYRKRSLNARYGISLYGLDTSQVRFASLSFDGSARSAEGLAHFDVEGDLAGKGIALGSGLDRVLFDVERAGQGTLAAPLAAQIRAALARETRGSTLAVNLILRRSSEGFSLVVPRGSLKGGSGASLLTLSRAQAMFGTGRLPRVTGNFAIGGQGLPQVTGRMEGGGRERLAMQVAMPEYRAGETRVALPRLALVQGANGALSFNGEARLTGELPGGRAENLVLPLAGNWAANGDLAIWPRCSDIAFDRLRFANLTLDRRRLSVCPAAGGAIVRGSNGDLRVALGVPALNLSGRLGETPIRIASGPLGLALGGGQPGALKARALKVELGPAETASHFSITDLGARIGKEVAGTFDEADIGLYAVPLDLRRTSGRWRYAAGVFSVEGATFTLVDRQPVVRFQPMIARDAVLRLADNTITAQATIREPSSDREVVRADIVHDLARAAGHADLAVDGIRFDDKLQADSLSGLALGVVSNLQGLVRGSGRIDWDAQGVTSHGRFATDGVDFAAAFGPVKGLSGEVVFTDLLGLVTAPDQTLRIASINPGIAVDDGTLSFEMKPGYFLQINGARWPFMDGTLTLDPAHMQIGVAETRYYTLKVSGLDAATFVQHLELSNISATGVFDGELPLVFDESGGRVENGYLVSRPPGGNVSYVGELTYKDLSAMGNFAFGALKSVDYDRMEIGLGGSLTGDIVTRVSFDGLGQGAGARRNFLTRQIARLPIRFIVNIRAPFFSLFGSMRSLYDPSYVADPRTLGLIDPKTGVRPALPNSTIQPPVSEKRP
ncbi:YdbH domain-containing protein [Novosphingobium sp. CF614]|uniref:YdbH domain-containing protein n=1 Tax=Novosphingobium sp. CF614 TaxID=1884364 RepID=UPI000B89C935|nr:YdbH domain-containing protein [Novosphingobium sp. CF614]